MGRIKTTLVKTISRELVEKYRENFTKEFEKNKKVVDKYLDVPSKKLRNVITGYVTRLVKKEQ
ncbi:30S ribosomal protein S17e [bacterium]|nr:30S ribosomal protein S17e [bacterium]